VKKRIISTLLVIAMGMPLLNGCIGNFVLTRKLLNFNQRLSNKWVNEIVFLAMVIIPVYGVCILIDGIILNSIEFWTGLNPLAMEEGQKETKIIASGDITYQVDVTKNHYHFVQLEGPNKGEAADLFYNPDTKTWVLGNGRINKRVLQVVDEKNVRLFTKSGDSITVSMDSNPEDVARLLSQRM